MRGQLSWGHETWLSTQEMALHPHIVGHICPVTYHVTFHDSQLSHTFWPIGWVSTGKLDKWTWLWIVVTWEWMVWMWHVCKHCSLFFQNVLTITMHTIYKATLGKVSFIQPSPFCRDTDSYSYIACLWFIVFFPTTRPVFQS